MTPFIFSILLFLHQPSAQLASTCTGYTTDCTIDCSTTDCTNNIIYGSGASSLTVNCDSQSGGCMGAQITCPSATCTINCEHYNACNAVIVYANNATSVTLNAKYDGSFTDGQFWAKNADLVTINCASGEDSSAKYACRDVEWYLPDYGHNTYINCMSWGCNYFGSIHVDTSISSLSIYFNGCEECCDRKQPTPLYFVDSWDISCKSNPSSYDEKFYGDHCTGSYGSSNAEDCGCNDAVVNVIFEDDGGDSRCFWRDDSDGLSMLLIILGSIVLILLFCCARGLCYYKARRPQQRYIHPQVQPATLQTQVVMVPAGQQIVMVPAGQQIVMQPMQQQYMQPVVQQQSNTTSVPSAPAQCGAVTHY